MRKAYFRGAVVAALLAAGCGVGNTLGTVPDSLGAPGLSAGEQAFLKAATTSNKYKVLVVDDADAATDADKAANLTCEVSSTRDATWFGMAHLTDGKLTSAWGPAASDEAPSLTIHLDGCMDVSALAIKQSGGVTMDVEAMVDGAWTTVATELTTQQAVLDAVDVSAMGATAIRITFDGDTSDLLVCEVEVWGTTCEATPTPAPSTVPSTAPSTTPSTMPSTPPSTTPSTMPSTTPTPAPTPTPTPTATPTPEPTPTPTPTACCQAITGNGNIEAETEAGVFKFEINTPSGRVNFRGPDRGQAFLPILSAVCTDTGAIVTADANNDGVGDTTFTLVGEAQGGHLKTTSVTIDGDLSLFPDFLTPVTDIQGSLNIFDDPDCDGTPNGQVD